MADLLQSSATTATTTPQYYTDYMTNLAQRGTAGGTAAQYVGATPLQQQAFGSVAQNVGNYQPSLTAAGQNYGAAANTAITGAANPYLQAGTQTSGLTQANPYLATGLAASGANAANPYLAAGTATSGASVANPLISQGAGINALSSANPYLTAGTTTSGASVANPLISQGAGINALSSANPYLSAGTQTSGLSQANPYLTSGTSSAADLVGNYMNPYTQSVVDQIRLANQQNIAQNLSPGITSGAVGSGQFGSQRGANALALGISNANIGALGVQNQALQSGYAQALTAAQQQRANQLAAGQTAGTLQNQFSQNQVNAGQIAGNLQNQTAQNQITAGQNLGALQNQFAQNQVNAGQIAGNLQNTMAQNQITAGQNLGALQNQANINQVNAGQVAGNLLNTYGQNALTAGQTAGTLQNQANVNQVTAGQAAANAAAQQAAAQTAAATGQLNLGQQIQQSGLADVNALSTLGQQQQQIEQNKQLFPLDVAAKQAAILSGAQIPTTVTQTMQGSPLSAIAGLGGLTAGMFASQPQYDPVTGRLIGSTTPAANLFGAIGSAIGSRGTNGGQGTGILGALSGIFPGSGPVPNPGFNTGAPDDYRPPYVGPTIPEDYQPPYVGPTTPGYTPVDNTYTPDYQAPYVGPTIPDYTPMDNTYVPDYQAPYVGPSIPDYTPVDNTYVPPNYQLPEYYEDY